MAIGVDSIKTEIINAFKCHTIHERIDDETNGQD
jgi:hypothetical protein